ncbi:hypothetical protein [Brevundimonas sp. UBA2416]|uniref:hypothetical protein n=1 Tax=Brevundimonas sp. UBA2416 TaxID=1946124 RepID=UPI0025C06AC0|nr:hypothetical protein [Brevundimonas sp. UBA2416]HRJ63470.1 hypothetical protein [Brevundimonas sp.]
MIGVLILLTPLQIPTEPVREIFASYDCAHRAYRDEVVCYLHMTVAPPPTSAAREIVVRYECLYRRNFRCTLRSRPPADIWARERTEDLARRFESRPPSRAMPDGEAFILSFRLPQDAAELPVAPEPVSED